MPSLRELADNLPNFNYYSGTGNFTQNNIKYPDPSVLFGPEATLMLKRPGFQWSPSNFDDGLVPFGVVTRLRRAIDDTARIGKYLSRTPSGLIFLIKQQALQASSPSIEYDPATSKLKDFGPTRIYSPFPLLAQVAGNAIGARFTRHGLLPKISNTQDYQNYILKLDKENQNRLSVLTSDLSDPNNIKNKQNYVLKYKGGPESKYGIGNTTINKVSSILVNSRKLPQSTNNREYQNSILKLDNENKSNLIVLAGLLSDVNSENNKQNYVLKYSGDTKSIYGIENTTISKYSSILIGKGEGVNGKDVDNNFIRIPISDLISINTVNPNDVGNNIDFRSYKNKAPFKKASSPKLPESDYQNNNLEKRIGIAKVRTANQKSESTNSEKSYVGTHDKINNLSLFYASSVEEADGKAVDYNGNVVKYNPDDKVGVRDLIKFRIKSIDNDNSNYGYYMVFRAYLTNIKRSFTSKWNPYNYVGRGESFYLYDGFTETVSLSFIVAASSRLEMKPLYQKLNYLISTLTPDYSSTDRKMRGNLSELTIGDFLLYQPGIITNFDMTIDEDSNWEISLDEPENGQDVDMHELPQLIKCSMTFIPIYNFLPNKNTKVPFIGIEHRASKEGQKWLTVDKSNKPAIK